LIFRSDNSAACEFSIDHPDIPTDEEIKNGCGDILFNEWKKSQSCSTIDGSDISSCTGLELKNINSTPTYKQIYVQLPVPEVKLSLGGCYFTQSSQYCNGEPILLFTGNEPLPNEQIVAIQGTYGDQDFYCASDHCSLNLLPTDPSGTTLTFWGDSSYGDSTEMFSALIRVIRVPGSDNGYQVDVISSQWSGKNPPSCSEIWNVFPESENLPLWLTTPNNAAQLESKMSLYYLAAALIRNKVVDASACEHNGLANNVTANECGLTAASEKIKTWQNQFDEQILTVSHQDGIPVNFLRMSFTRKSILAWRIYSISEVGLGQFTENGADTVLLWNKDFYNAFCHWCWMSSIAAKVLRNWPTYGQAVLKGALLKRSMPPAHLPEGSISVRRILVFMFLPNLSKPIAAGLPDHLQHNF
jgi:hypothetical protein